MQKQQWQTQLCFSLDHKGEIDPAVAQRRSSDQGVQVISTSFNAQNE